MPKIAILFSFAKNLSEIHNNQSSKIHPFNSPKIK